MLGILLPTLIHVSLFTLVFMALGALRSGQRVQWMLIAIYLAAIALILVMPPTAATLVPAFAKAANEYFALVAPALGRLFGIPGLTLDNRIVSLLAFVYTYHYLNWFIKAEVIRWADISRERLAIVTVGERGLDRAVFLRLRLWLQRPAGVQPCTYRAGVPAEQHGVASTCRGDPPAHRKNGSAARLSAATRPPRRAEFPPWRVILRPLTGA